jgi:hypothetical protein
VKIQVELNAGVPDRVRRALAAVREVEVSDGLDSRISIEGRDRPLTILSRPQPTPDPDQAARDLARHLPRGSLGLVVAPSIPRRERESIEEAGLSWCDGRGAMHVAWPGVLVHIDHGAGRHAPSKSANGVTGLGPAGIRALQVLLGADEDDWTVSRLAERAAISVGQAHNVFRALEENRLVETTGKGPRQRRVITDRRAALDWLATIDRARRRPEAAATYLYGRTNQEVLARFAERAGEAGLPYAVTAAAGSHLLGVPVMSNVVVAQVRVGVLDATDALQRLELEHLDAEDAGRGMNLELWTDTGELGTFGATDVEGIRVAPKIRVWLDMARQGGRNDDAAQLFREQVLERS